MSYLIFLAMVNVFYVSAKAKEVMQGIDGCVNQYLPIRVVNKNNGCVNYNYFALHVRRNLSFSHCDKSFQVEGSLDFECNKYEELMVAYVHSSKSAREHIERYPLWMLVGRSVRKEMYMNDAMIQAFRLASLTGFDEYSTNSGSEVQRENLGHV